VVGRNRRDGSSAVDHHQFHHVILTPFNCLRSKDPDEGKWQIRLNPEWIEHRFVLFERYCLPSLIKQSNQNFLWWIYFDRHTPLKFLDRIRKDLDAYSHYQIKLCDLYGSETVQDDLRQELHVSKAWLVTTRLDNDDGLNRGFVEWLHEKVRVGRKEAIEFPWGIVWANGRPYLSYQKHNAFISISESRAHCRSVLGVQHKFVGREYPVQIAGSQPAWLQTVHDANVSNKIRGWRISRKKLPDTFEVPNDIYTEAENIFSIWTENATWGGVRCARDVLADTWRTLKYPPGLGWIRRPVVC
jgi:hypothetical protein